MVLERLQRLWRRDESGLGFDNPDAFRSGEDVDCLSCRVVGMDACFQEIDLRLHLVQGRQLSSPWEATLITVG